MPHLASESLNRLFKIKLSLMKSSTDQLVPTFTMITIGTGDITAKISTYGATLTHLYVKNGQGEVRDVVLGFDQEEDYASKKNMYFGCTVGRVANRISRGRFELDGKIFDLPVNNGPNINHSGKFVYSFIEWKLIEKKDDLVSLMLIDQHSEEGYPGTLNVFVTYKIQDMSLIIEFEAFLSDIPCNVDSTILNLTNHSYFNLSGSSSSILDNHHFQFFSDRYLELDSDSVPTGNIIQTSSQQVMHMQNPKILRGSIEQLAMGYDHYYVIKQELDTSLTKAGQVICDGLKLEFFTTEPGFQFYTGNYLDANLIKPTKQSHDNKPYGKWDAFCLEAHRFPDAINKSQWRDQVILKKGKKYHQKSVFSFAYLA